MACSKVALVLVLATLGSVTIADADWQYTKWGMTADQIVAASSGAARLVPSDQVERQSGADFTTIALGTFSTGPFSFNVSFRARKGESKLHYVRLELNDPSRYGDLLNSLKSKYGEGESSGEKSSVATSTKNRWQANPDTIVLMRLEWSMTRDEHVSVDYIETVSDANL